VTATAQPKYHEGFLPLLPGLSYIPFNDVEALEAAFTDEVAAVLVEPIQGEGGINVATPEFLQAIRRLCDEKGAVMILDEVQTGVGRTGKWFGYQHYDVEPDIITMAKALGGGVAIGAMMARDGIAACLVPGKHASTFGGNCWPAPPASRPSRPSKRKATCCSRPSRWANTPRTSCGP
jgi:acetylornithine/N-succinyldiaminopimelate aminotransferase